MHKSSSAVEALLKWIETMLSLYDQVKKEEREKAYLEEEKFSVDSINSDNNDT